MGRELASEAESPKFDSWPRLISELSLCNTTNWTEFLPWDLTGLIITEGHGRRFELRCGYLGSLPPRVASVAQHWQNQTWSLTTSTWNSRKPHLSVQTGHCPSSKKLGPRCHQGSHWHALPPIHNKYPLKPWVDNDSSSSKQTQVPPSLQ